ncbi:MAG TPA: ATP-binding protein [Ktedonobacterales bacterium]|nr:ATP-binding protein [Ktedonobacterales bacterium]
MIPMAWRDRWSAYWLSASLLRALAEVLLVQLLALTWEFLFAIDDSSRVFSRATITVIIIMGPCCILWCVFRMRRPALPWRGRLIRYCGLGIIVAIAPTIIFAELWHIAVQSSLIAPQRGIGRFPLILVVTLSLLAFSNAFIISRIGVRLIVIWNRMRRRRLVWSLTNAHLLVVILGSCLLTAALMLANLSLNPGRTLSVLPILFFVFIMTVVLLLVVLPPSALFSYLFAHRTTRRLETLADATSALRAGDYGVRVPVEGENEVAQLQANFNAMAADLEQAVRELKAERDNVATLLNARRELIASVSHELRTPVATLRGYLESTRTHWDEAPPPTLRQDLLTMERETLRLQALIDDLFMLARAEIGRLETRREPVDVGMVARRVVETMAPLAWQSNRVEVAASLAETLPAALADASRVEQVLLNLMRNGVHHTPPGGIVAVEASVDGGALVLRVKDTGEGIAPEDLPHIWDRFYRTRRSREQDTSGTGLGLALVKELTEVMGGSVAVTSMLGEGSCFTVRLPLAASPTRPADTPAAGSHAHASAPVSLPS